MVGIHSKWKSNINCDFCHPRVRETVTNLIVGAFRTTRIFHLTAFSIHNVCKVNEIKIIQSLCNRTESDGSFTLHSSGDVWKGRFGRYWKNIQMQQDMRTLDVNNLMHGSREPQNMLFACAGENRLKWNRTSWECKWHRGLFEIVARNNWEGRQESFGRRLLRCGTRNERNRANIFNCNAAD